MRGTCSGKTGSRGFCYEITPEFPSANASLWHWHCLMWLLSQLITYIGYHPELSIFAEPLVSLLLCIPYPIVYLQEVCGTKFFKDSTFWIFTWISVFRFAANSWYSTLLLVFINIFKFQLA